MQVDATVEGEALETFGLTARDTISGIGLVTFGFLWECAAIWEPSDESVTTNWSNSDSPITTNWTNSDSALTTTWIGVSGGIWGNC